MGDGCIVAAWLWLTRIAILAMLAGPFFLPGILAVSITLAGGITLAVLTIHNEADEKEHTDRYYNWFRLTGRD